MREAFYGWSHRLRWNRSRYQRAHRHNRAGIAGSRGVELSSTAEQDGGERRGSSI